MGAVLISFTIVMMMLSTNAMVTVSDSALGDLTQTPLGYAALWLNCAYF